MVIHRRQLHKYVRYQDVDINEYLLGLSSAKIEQVRSVVAHRKGTHEYKVIFQDGSSEYIIMPNHDARVLAFFERTRKNIEEYDVNMGSWIQPIQD